MAEACRCPTFEHALKTGCHRAKQRMNLTLWELCAAAEPRRCGPECSEAYRQLWDRLPGDGGDQPAPAPPAQARKWDGCRHLGAWTGRFCDEET